MSHSYLDSRIHEGEASDNAAIDFGAFASDLFTRQIRPQFGGYLRRVFRVLCSSLFLHSLVYLVSYPALSQDSAPPESPTSGEAIHSQTTELVSTLQLVSRFLDSNFTLGWAP